MNNYWEADGGVSQRLIWRVWPARKRPGLSLAVGLFCLALASVTAWIWETPAYGVVAIIILGVALAPHFLPTCYYVNADGLVARGGAGFLRYRWEALQQAYDLGDRLLLIPSRNAGSGRAWRRSLAILTADNHTAVVAFVATYLPVSVLPGQEGDL